MSVLLEGEKAGALKGQFSGVALCYQAVFRTFNEKFHMVAAVYLKDYIITGRGGMMKAMGTGSITGNGLRMEADICALGYRGGRNGQPGGVIILVPCAKAFCQRDEEDYETYERNQYGCDAENTVSHKTSYSHGYEHFTFMVCR